MEPVGKGRARSTRSGHHYTPAKTVAAEAKVRDAFVDALQGRSFEPYAEPVCMTLIATFAAPKCSAAKREAMLHTPCEKRPDADNVLKLVADALNGAAYDDDKRIVRATVVKLWGDVGSLMVDIKPEVVTCHEAR